MKKFGLFALALLTLPALASASDPVKYCDLHGASVTVTRTQEGRNRDIFDLSIRASSGETSQLRGPAVDSSVISDRGLAEDFRSMQTDFGFHEAPTSGTAYRLDLAQDGIDMGMILVATYGFASDDEGFLISDVVAGPQFFGTKNTCRPSR